MLGIEVAVGDPFPMCLYGVWESRQGKCSAAEGAAAKEIVFFFF